MSDDEKLYRTIVQVEVLSRGPLEFEDLADLHEMITDGHFSGEYEVKSSEVVGRAEMRKLLEAQRSDPDFFDELDEDDEVEWEDVKHSHEVGGDGVQITWTYIGEGVEGDYDPEDPEDEPRLRADVVIFENYGKRESEVLSYCTLAPVGTPLLELERMLFDLSDGLRADPDNPKTVVELWVQRTRPQHLGDL